ncbi:MAG: ABC transporter ATP-binding protein [Acidimicrobiales bacterium mtb01]|nr:ABC transporter ATP-binding protein [Actinomycetota bacterium]TEX45693.1 MAG: ABC transporter ATP-binding protein [Acidimicrobiales bacterium mtb01]
MTYSRRCFQEGRGTVGRELRKPGFKGATKVSGDVVRGTPRSTEAEALPSTEAATSDAEPAEATGLRADGLFVSYGGVKAVTNVSLAVQPGQIVGLIGPNGAGKTSMIDALSGFAPHTGSVTLGGGVLDGVGPAGRARLGLVRTWQSADLFRDLTLIDGLRVAASQTKVGGSGAWSSMKSRRERSQSDDARLLQLLEMLGIDHLKDRWPDELPLGQRKVASVARALACNPKFILLDEPAAGLDPPETAEFALRLRQVAHSGTGLLLVEHDMSLVMSVCSRVVVMSAGAVIAQGTPLEIQADQRVLDAYLGA